MYVGKLVKNDVKNKNQVQHKNCLNDLKKLFAVYFEILKFPLQANLNSQTQSTKTMIGLHQQFPHY